MCNSDIASRWPSRALLRLIIPLVIEQLLAVSVGTVDMIMVSSIGEYAVSGVDIVNTINNLFIIAFAALASGGAVITGQYIGRGDRENACGSARQLIYLMTAVASVILLIVVFNRAFLINMLYGTLSPDVREAAEIYLLFTALSYPFLALNNASAALFRAAGDSRASMLATLFSNILNICGNGVFIFALRMGVPGAALSTLISRIIPAVILFALLVVRGCGPLSLAGIHRVIVKRDMMVRISRIAVPGGLESSMYSIGKLITQRVFPLFGTGAIAANAVANTTDLLAVMPGVAFSMALTTVVGQCAGARDYEGARRLTARIMRWTYLTLFIISGTVFIVKEPLVALFHLSREAEGMAKLFVIIGCFTEAFAFGAAFTLPGALRAAGDIRFTLIAPTVSMWVLRVGGSLLLARVPYMGPCGVWVAMSADNICRGVCNILRWRSGRWQTKRVIED
jgi:putative MATE family efflux protein